MCRTPDESDLVVQAMGVSGSWQHYALDFWNMSAMGAHLQDALGRAADTLDLIATCAMRCSVLYE